MIILDTNVISEVMKPVPSANVLAWLDRQAEDALYLTAITVAEMSAGIQKLDAGRRRDDLNRRFQEMLDMFAGRLLSFDSNAGIGFGDIIGNARRAGLAISLPDGLIAAIALDRKSSVATRDGAPFKAAGVVVINPWEPDVPATN